MFTILLRNLVGQELEVAIGNELYYGTLNAIVMSVLTLQETVDSYERETRTVLVPISEISFVRLNEAG